MALRLSQPRWLIAAGLALLPLHAAPAQMATQAPAVVPGAKPVTIERIKVHSPAIEGNLEGNSPDRDVIVVLPPDYARDKARRYPVVYALHGYSIGADQWTKEIHVPFSIEGAFARGVPPMILVFPDSRTMHNGSMYSSSQTVGDFERFVSHDLIAAIDARYRTIARREARGLVGHSMGGYGTSRIGMKHADMYGAIYMMSPCCLSPRMMARPEGTDEKLLTGLASPKESEKLNWGQRAMLAASAAWSPNPKNPPLYLDLPVKDGKVRDDVMAKWLANTPLAFVDQYITPLRSYRAIALDVGSEDGLKADAQALHDTLDRYGIAHRFEIYEGDHVNRIGVRFQDKVLPFFGEMLTAKGGR
ncbi:MULTISPECIES: alpha/beta fold hydrolase [unclassified Sphingomonas]|uniref:alpha/beta hydrolase n=1 Tax=unclassified Sphingomonas TaxID=196159 RepID=UPI00285BE652|nr:MULTISPECIES: alpha/beta fold hydrolase [unclassified Sphingomonas]MDR6115633.1 enterochelin esterase-like enzyme [Sphingomonas sp. SORGH_AS_0789]MDR6150696.1 enterochelin esterase-like enzyme [Sphingomonas sp. SORGH_AS_0742]